MTWYRHLPGRTILGAGDHPYLRDAWSPTLVHVARALVVYPWDERCAWWSVVECNMLEAMAAEDRVTPQGLYAAVRG